MFRAIERILAAFAGRISARPAVPTRFQRKPLFEALERRILLSADPLGAAESLADPAPLVFDAPVNATADSYTLRFNADIGELELLGGTSVLASRSLSATSAVIINGEDGQDDNLTIDFAFGGVFSLEDGILYNGGAGGIDKLTTAGGAFETIAHTATDAGPGLSGSIALEDGVHAPLTIAYTDLEPIDLTGSTATSLVLNLTAGGDLAVLEDDGIAGNGISRLRSVNGMFESTTFSNTATSVTIAMGAGEDLLNVTSLPDYQGALTVNGGAGAADAVIFSGTESFSALSVTVAGTIGDAAGTDLAVTGNARFVGSSVVLGDNAADITTFGSLTFNSSGVASISEDGDMALAGGSTAGSLSLNTSSALTDTATGSLVVSDNANIAAFSVFVADQSTNTFSVGGHAFFDVPLFLTIGANGVTNFGSLAFSSDSVFIVEDSGTVLAGTSSSSSAILLSFGSLTDAVGTSLSVADFAELRAAAGITLGDNAADVTNFGTLTFSSLGAVSIAEDSGMVLDRAVSAAAVTLISSGTLEINAAIVATGGNVDLRGVEAVRGTAAGTITTELGGVQIVSGNLSGVAGEVDLAGDIDTSGEDSDTGDGGDGGAVQVFTRGGTITLADIDTSGGDSGDIDVAAGDGGNVTIEGGAVTLNGGVLARAGGGGDVFGDILVNQGLSTGGSAVTLAGGLIWGRTITIKGSSLTQNAGAAIIGIDDVTLAGLDGAVVLDDTVNFTAGNPAVGLRVSAASTLDINAAISAFDGSIELYGAEAVRSTAAGTITSTTYAVAGYSAGSVLVTSGRFPSIGGLAGLAGEVDLAGDIDASGADSDPDTGLPGGSAGGAVQVFTRGGAITLAEIDTSGGDSSEVDVAGGDGGSVTIEGGVVTLNGGVLARAGSGFGGAFGDILVNESLSTGGSAVTLAGGLIWGRTITIKGSSLTQNAGAAIIGIDDVTLAGLDGAVVLDDTVNFTAGNPAVGLRVSAASTLDINAAISAFDGSIELYGAEAVRSTAAGTITSTTYAVAGYSAGSVLVTSGRFPSIGGLAGLAGEVDLAGDIDASGADSDPDTGLPGGSAGGAVQVFTRGGAITLAEIDTSGGDSSEVDVAGGDGGSVTIEGGVVTLNGGVLARAGSGFGGAFGDILVNESLSTGGSAVTLAGGLIWGRTITIKGSSLTQNAGAAIIGIDDVTLAGLDGAVVLDDTVNFTAGNPAVGLRVSAASTLDINAAISAFDGSIELYGAEAVRSTAAGTITSTTYAVAGYSAGSVLVTSGRFPSIGGLAGLAGEVDLAGDIDASGADSDPDTGLPGGSAGGAVQVFALGGAVTLADIDTRGGSPISGPDGADGGIAIEGGEITLTGSLHSGASLITLGAGAAGVVVTDSATLNVEIVDSLMFTRVEISGQVTLDGTLHAELNGNFVLLDGHRFRFMTFDSRDGFFAATQLPPGFAVDQSDATDLELVFEPDQVAPTNDAPVRTAGAPAPVVVNEDSANINAVSLGLGGLAYAPGPVDEAGQTLTYSVTSIPSFIAVFLADGATQVTAGSVLSDINALRGLTYKTLADANGSANLVWRVTDSGPGTPPDANTLTESLSITVNAVLNDAPVRTAGAPAPVVVNEDSANVNAVSLGLGGLAYAPGPVDEAGQTLTYAVTSIPSFIAVFLADGATQVTAGSVLSDINALRGLTYKTLADANGSANLVWRVTDSGPGTPPDANTLTESLSITVVHALNDAPVRTSGAPAPVVVNEDSANVNAVSLGLGGLAYAPGPVDELGQTLTYAVTSIPSFIAVFLADGATQVTAGSVLSDINALRGLTYKTLADANGSANLVWTVTDSGPGTPPDANTLTESLSITVNAVEDDAPSVAIYETQADPINAGPILYLVLFSEAVTGFDASDVDLSASTLSGLVATVSGSGASYTLSVTGMNGVGTVVPSIGAGAAMDSVGQGSFASTSPDSPTRFDNVRPTVTIDQAPGQVDPTLAGPIEYSVVFSEEVVGFGADDISFAGSTLGGLVATVSGVGANYTVSVSGMASEGYVVASLAAGAAFDIAGNVTFASTSTDNTVVFSDGAPSVAIYETQADPINAGPILYMVLFSEAVTGFDASDVDLSASTLSGLVATVSGSGASYTLSVTGMNGVGTVVPSIGAGAAMDSVGQGSFASTSPDSPTRFDNVRPTVTIDQAPGQVDPTLAGPIEYSVVFSEEVVGFGADDISFAGSTLGGLVATVSGVGANYTVSVSGMASEGYVVASLAAGAAFDIAGNVTFASTSTDNTVVFSDGAPSVAIYETQADPINAGPILYMVLFSEAVTGFDASDVDLSASTLSGLVATVSGSGASYTLSVTGMNGVGTVVPSIGAGAAMDSVGQGSFASTSPDSPTRFDNVRPTVTIDQAPGQVDPTLAGPIEYSVVFSEEVVGFGADDISFAGSTLGGLVATVSGVGANYTVSVSGMASEGYVVASLAAGAAFDIAGNVTFASTSTDNTVFFDDNDAPVFVEIGPQTVQEGRELRFTVSATDADGDALTYAAGPLPVGASFNPATREFVWLPLDEGSASVTFTVTDPDGESDTMTVALTAINAAPTVDAGADQVVGLQDIDDCDDHGKHHKDKPEAEVSIAAVFDDLGLSDTHTATIDWGDCSSSTGKVVEPTATADGAVKGKHTYTRAGDYTVTVTVRDNDGGVTTDTLTVKVRKPIEKKNFDSKGDEYKLTEDTVLTVNAAHGVLDNDRGPSGAALKARVVEGPEHGKLLFNADGSFTYVPDRNFHGKDSFWYEFTDGNNVSRAVEVKLNVKDDKDRHSPRCIDWDDDWRSPWNDCFMPFGKRWR